VPNHRTLYDTLGVAPQATPARIRAAFAAKLDELRDADGPVAARERSELERAHATLIDADKRDQYHAVIGLPAYASVMPEPSGDRRGPILLAVIVVVAIGLMVLGMAMVLRAAKQRTAVDMATAAPSTSSSAAVPIRQTYDYEADRIRAEFDRAREDHEDQRNAQKAAADAYAAEKRDALENAKQAAEAARQQLTENREREREELASRQRAALENAQDQLRDLQQR
jgi:hypothetical protein